MSFYKCDFNEETGTKYVWSRVPDEKMKQLVDKKIDRLSNQNQSASKSVWSAVNATAGFVSASGAALFGALMFFVGMPILFLLISLGVLTAAGVSEIMRRVSVATFKQLRTEELQEIETEISQASIPVPLLFFEMAEEYFSDHEDQSYDDKMLRLLRGYISDSPYTITRSDGEFSSKLFDWLESHPEEIENVLTIAGDKMIELDRCDIEKYPEEFNVLKDLLNDTFIRIDQRRQLDEQIELENKHREEAWRREDEEMEQSQTKIDEQINLEEYEAKLHEEQILSQQTDQQKRYEREALIEGIKALKKTEGPC